MLVGWFGISGTPITLVTVLAPAILIAPVAISGIHALGLLQELGPAWARIERLCAPALVASASNGIGFLSLRWVGVPALSDLGTALGVGIAAAGAASLLGLPAWVGRFGNPARTVPAAGWMQRAAGLGLRFARRPLLTLAMVRTLLAENHARAARVRRAARLRRGTPARAPRGVPGARGGAEAVRVAAAPRGIGARGRQPASAGRNSAPGRIGAPAPGTGMGAAMKRRTFLKAGVGGSAGLALGFGPRWLRGAFADTGARWRNFEVITQLEVAEPKGITRAWVPVPLLTPTDYLERRGDSWTGNANAARVVEDRSRDLGLVYAEWPAGESAPRIEITSRFSTRDRSVDLARPPATPPREDAAVLARYLAPTRLIPTDGIVRDTAREITQGARTDLDKARAIYEWIVENTFRDPKVRGCGLGDIQTMLETRYFGGKCADLNTLFVGLARASGLPARDVYGLRCADSAEFKCLGKSGDISKAQHCRAEVHLAAFGWVPVDPADVRKVVLEERPGGLALGDPLAQRARAKLFGQWEMNWLAYNYGHDLTLLNSAGAPLPFLMYPQAETAAGRRDCLDPATFRYQISAREIAA